jgi:adsorption protein B
MLGVWLIRILVPEAYRYPPLVEVGSWLWYVIVIDTVFLFWRALQRAVAVKRIYGWKQALVSLPRQIWLNVINFLATTRAMYLFARYLVTGELIPWDKTAHVYPTADELRSYRKRLGELLLEKRFISVNELEAALDYQKESGKPLGAVLLEMTPLTEDQLVQVLGVQLQVSTREIDPYSIPLEVLHLLPRPLAIKYSLFPLEVNKNRLVVAAEKLLSSQEIRAVETELDRRVEIVLTTRSDVFFAIARGYARLQMESNQSIGQKLVEEGVISEIQLKTALREQRRSYTRLGDILLDNGVIDRETLDNAVEAYSPEMHGRFGGFLVQNEIISPRQLDRALTIQQEGVKRLGDILAEKGFISHEMDAQKVERIPDGEGLR